MEKDSLKKQKIQKDYQIDNETLIKDLKEELEYEQFCNEKLRKKITNLEYKIKRLEEENRHIFANVNDDQLLRSNAMTWVELQDYKSRIDKAIEYLEYQLTQLDFYEDTKAKMLCAMLIVILKGGNNE